MSDERSSDLGALRGYLSIGSNLGEREASVLGAMRLIDEGEGIEVSCSSSLYETSPVDGVGGGFFINSVLGLLSLLSPTDLLLRMRSIERRMGRSGGHNAAREIDVDIVALEGVVLQDEALTLPHPRYAKRAFVLLPLREIAPDFRCPLTGRHIDQMIAGLPPDQEITLVSTRRALCY